MPFSSEFGKHRNYRPLFVKGAGRTSGTPMLVYGAITNNGLPSGMGWILNALPPNFAA
jgi:hypothetical protein